MVIHSVKSIPMTIHKSNIIYLVNVDNMIVADTGKRPFNLKLKALELALVNTDTILA